MYSKLWFLGTPLTSVLKGSQQVVLKANIDGFTTLMSLITRAVNHPRYNNITRASWFAMKTMAPFGTPPCFRQPGLALGGFRVDSVALQKRVSLLPLSISTRGSSNPIIQVPIVPASELHRTEL